MKIAVVTGAGGNLGRAVADKFSHEGYHVLGTVSRREDPMENTNKNVEHTAVDLTDETATQRFIADVIDRFQRIDVAVLTVGGFAMGKIADTSSADLMHQYRLNFETAYNAARAVLKQMLLQKEGRIFLVGSRPGSDMHASKGMVAYGLAKSLIFRLAELMNDEAKGTNVVTMVIVPGTIDTPENRKAMPDADRSHWVKPEAIAEVIYVYTQEVTAQVKEGVIRF